MESQSQNPEFRINPENFHQCISNRGHSQNTYGPRRDKTGLLGFANNKGADQTADEQVGLHLFYLLTGKYHI